MSEDLRPNPFCHMGKYYWRDAQNQTHGPYKDQRDALFSLLKHAYPDFQTDTSREWLAFILPLIALVTVIIFGCWLLK